jgi:1-acyl-sn-glycerol-3-phosphate acyltransferase
MSDKRGYKTWYIGVLFKNFRYLSKLFKHVRFTVKLLEKEKDYRQRYKLAGKNLMDTFNMKQDDVNISGIEYLDHTQNVLIVMNHDSNIDPFMVMGSTSTIIQGRFVSDADSRGVSKTNDKYFESLHVLYMDRHNLKRAYSDSKHIIEALKSDNVFIFPQGKVNLNGVVKTGTFKMAKNANVGILPLKISNSNAVLNYDDYRFDEKKIKEVYFKFHPIISAEEVQKTSSKELAEKIGKILSD